MKIIKRKKCSVVNKRLKIKNNNPNIFQLVPEASVVSGSEDSTPSPISGDDDNNVNEDDDDDNDDNGPDGDDDDHELYVVCNEIMVL